MTAQSLGRLRARLDVLAARHRSGAKPGFVVVVKADGSLSEAEESAMVAAEASGRLVIRVVPVPLMKEGPA